MPKKTLKDPWKYYQAVKECKANAARSGPVKVREMTDEERKRYGLDKLK